MIVDIHVHLPRLFLGDEEDVAAVVPAVEKMLEAGHRAGIDRQVILGLKGNWALKQVADRFPDRIIPFLKGSCIDPEGPATAEKYVTEYGFKGIKIHEERPQWPLTGLLSGFPLFQKAGQLGVPVLIHSWHPEEGLETAAPGAFSSGYFPALLIEELGRRHPETIFIMAHVGGMWIKSFQAAQPYTNISFDVCGFDPERGIVETAVKMLGAERVYYGSDAPGRNFAAQIAKVLYADISETDRQLILGGNAARLLDLR